MKKKSTERIVVPSTDVLLDLSENNSDAGIIAPIVSITSLKFFKLSF